MGVLWLLLLWSCACGGYACAALSRMKSKIARGLMWASIVSNGIAALIIAAIIASVFSSKVIS